MAETDTSKQYDSLLGGLTEIGLKRLIFSRDFILASILGVLMGYLVAYSCEDFLHDAQPILIAYASAGAALLGLVIAAYSIFASFGQPDYLFVLVKGGVYYETVTLFAWSGLVLVFGFVASILDLGVITVATTHEGDVLARSLFVVASWLVLYGVLLVAVLLTNSLRLVNILRGEHIEKTRKGKSD